MAMYGDGLDEDWQMVLEMCSLETASLKPGVRQNNSHEQVRHIPITNKVSSGFCLSHEQVHHNKYPKVTIISSRLSHEQVCHNNNAFISHSGSCHLLDQQHHNKQTKATDFCPGDRNLEENYADENEAICKELACHYTHCQYGMKDPMKDLDHMTRKSNRF